MGFLTNHASLKILKQPPGPVDVLGEEVTRESHAGVVGPSDSLLFGIELEQGHDGSESLLLRNQHLVLGASDECRLEEVSVITRSTMQSLTTQDDLAALLSCVGDLRLSFVQTARGRDRAHCRLLISTVTYNQLFRLGSQNLGELFIDTLLNKHAVRGNAGLAGMSPLECQQFCDMSALCGCNITIATYGLRLAPSLRHRKPRMGSCHPTRG